jgi:indole-3-glycerol phosphate synthase
VGFRLRYTTFWVLDGQQLTRDRDSRASGQAGNFTKADRFRRRRRDAVSCLNRYTFCTVPTKLEEIIAATRRRIASAKESADLRALEAAATNHQPRGFRSSLQSAAKSGIAVIAELKKASPSKGLIRADFPVAKLAREFETAGATALSVLTDEKYFQGSLQNLESASQVTSLPCLRKDFIVEEFQLIEARAHGADAILLIVAALDQSELKRLYQRAHDLELDVLCEVHDAVELQRAMDAGCETIGVNNRNLHTFQVDLNTSLQLAELMPIGVLKVTESGIESGDDIARLRQVGFDAFLIGESLMRAQSPGKALRDLLAPSVAAP